MSYIIDSQGNKCYEGEPFIDWSYTKVYPGEDFTDARGYRRSPGENFYGSDGVLYDDMEDYASHCSGGK